MKVLNWRYLRLLAPLLLGGTLAVAIACGDDAAPVEKIVVQTVVVEKQVPGERVVETVIVEKQVAGETVVETVVVEKQVEVEKQVVQTVVVEKQVQVEKQVVQTVVVEKQVEVEKQVQVEVVVTATPTPLPTVAGIEAVAIPDPQSEPGMVVLALGEVLDENGLNQAQSPDNYKEWGLAESMYRTDPVSADVQFWLGREWDVADDFSRITIKLEENAEMGRVDDGVFKSYGMMDAADVAWSMNNANAITNPQSIHGQAGDFAGLWNEWEVVDDHTISFTVNSFDATWQQDYAGDFGQAFSVLSRKANLENGDDWSRDHVVATGVYLAEEWSRANFGILVDRAEFGHPHWLYETGFTRVKLIEVPSSVTRAAVLKTGEADAAFVEARDVPQFSEGGWALSGAQRADHQGVFFAGNLWETESAVDGSPLVRGTYVHDLAWLSKSEEEDAEDYAEALAVRQAMARAIDREAVNQTIVAGLGHPVHVEYVSPLDPRWQSKWEYPYDPELSIEILRGENSTYPIDPSGDGTNYRQDQVSDEQQEILNGNAFSVSLYTPNVTGTNNEIANAVGGYWSDIGLQVYVIAFSYVTFRPTVVGRTNTHPWLTQCDKGNDSWPWHFPKGLVQTSLTRGGFGCGFELPFVLDNYKKVAVEADQEKRAALVDEYVEYVYEIAIQPGVVAVPELYVVNPKKISGWEQARGRLGSRFWAIMPAGG